MAPRGGSTGAMATHEVDLRKQRAAGRAGALTSSAAGTACLRRGHCVPPRGTHPDATQPNLDWRNARDWGPLCASKS